MLTQSTHGDFAGPSTTACPFAAGLGQAVSLSERSPQARSGWDQSKDGVCGPNTGAVSLGLPGMEGDLSPNVAWQPSSCPTGQPSCSVSISLARPRCPHREIAHFRPASLLFSHRDRNCLLEFRGNLVPQLWWGGGGMLTGTLTGTGTRTRTRTGTGRESWG